MALQVVDPAQLEAAVDALGQTFAQLQGHIGDLQSAVAPMLDVWQGAARDGYFQCQTQWTTAAQDIGATIHQLRIAAEQAKEEYVANEQRNANMFGGGGGGGGAGGGGR